MRRETTPDEVARLAVAVLAKLDQRELFEARLEAHDRNPQVNQLLRRMAAEADQLAPDVRSYIEATMRRGGFARHRPRVAEPDVVTVAAVADPEPEVVAVVDAEAGVVRIGRFARLFSQRLDTPAGGLPRRRERPGDVL